MRLQPGGRPADDTPLVNACASAEVAVLARGTRVAAVRVADGKPLWQLDAEAEVGVERFPLALQPTGGQVAVCIPKIKAVSLRDMQTRKEIKQLTGGLDGWFAGAKYSSDGSLVLVFGDFGTKFYTAATGELLHSLVDKEGAKVCNCTRPASSGKFLVVTAWGAGAAFVKDREGGEKNVHALDDSTPTGGVSFDDAGERMAYWLCGKNAAGGNDMERNGQVIICDAQDGGFRELKRFTVPSLGWAQNLQFSPGDGRYLLSATLPSQGDNRKGTMLILDADPGCRDRRAACLERVPPRPGATGGPAVLEQRPVAPAASRG